MSEAFPYKRLPGRLRGWVRKASLWEGADHMLLVRGTRFQEDYRRFAYRDIQSLQMVRAFRPGSFGWLVFSALMCMAVLLPALRQSVSPRLVIAGGVLALLLGQLVRSIFFGCRCYVQTAVSREELPSLIRRGAAEKTFGRLRARIAEAQGVLSEDLSALVDASEVTDAGAANLRAARAEDAKTDNVKAALRSVNLALIGFVLFLVDALQSYPSLAGPSVRSTWYSGRFVFSALALSMVGTITGSLLASFGVRRLRGLRGWLIAALVTEVFDLYVSLFLPSLYTVQRGIVSINMPQFRVWTGVTYTDEILLLTIGLGGIVFVLVNWVRLRRSDI